MRLELVNMLCINMNTLVRLDPTEIYRFLCSYGKSEKLQHQVEDFETNGPSILWQCRIFKFLVVLSPSHFIKPRSRSRYRRERNGKIKQL
jgi:hypothetical protein